MRLKSRFAKIQGVFAVAVFTWAFVGLTSHTARAQDIRTVTLRGLTLNGPHELNIQGASASGGDSGLVAAPMGRDIPFSATGKITDVVFILDSSLQVISAHQLGALALDPSVPKQRPNVRLPDGQTRTFPILSRHVGPLINGGFIGIFRPAGQYGIVMDLDPIIIY
jgi:hypothetical protein